MYIYAQTHLFNFGRSASACVTRTYICVYTHVRISMYIYIYIYIYMRIHIQTNLFQSGRSGSACVMRTAGADTKISYSTKQNPPKVSFIVVTYLNPKPNILGRWRGYGVATTSRLLKIIGLFCKRAL